MFQGFAALNSVGSSPYQGDAYESGKFSVRVYETVAIETEIFVNGKFYRRGIKCRK